MDYTTTEAASILSMQPQTIRKHIKRGNIAARVSGRDYLIDQEELERFKRERRRPGQPRREGGRKANEQNAK